MRKTLLTVLTVLVTLVMALCLATACQKETGALTITGRPNGDSVTITDTVDTLTLGCGETDARWTSSDETVATVNGGTVKLRSAGSTVISVEKNGQKTAFILTVLDARAPASVSVTLGGVPQDGEVLLTSGSVQLSATCSDGSETVWYSRNETVATVDGTGKVTFLQSGSVEIVAQKKDAPNVYAVCALKVLDAPVTALEDILGIPQSGNVGMGKTLRLSLVTNPVKTAPFKTDWTVANAEIARVSETGELIGLQLGTTVVTATVQGTDISVSKTVQVVESKQNYEDFSSAVVIGNYIVGAIEIRDASNVLSPEIVYDETADNSYLRYSHAKANGNNKYMVYSFTGLEKGARYVLKYNMKVLSKDGSYNHQINLYSDIDVPVAMNDPLVGNVYAWHTTGLNTTAAKIYQSGSGALYRDGARWKDSDDSTDGFHEYTLGFIAGETTVGFAFVNNNTFEALFDYICVEKAPEVAEYELTPTKRLPVGERYTVQAYATSSALVYYQPFRFDWESSDTAVATVDENGCITGVSAGEVTITATDRSGKSVEMQVEIIPALTDTDKEAYDIFYEETNENVENTYLNLKYALPETQKVTGAVLYDSYVLQLELDALYYAGELQMYIGFERADGTLIGQRFWTGETLPLSGEKCVREYTITLGWPDKGAGDISTLQLYFRYGTDYQIGVNVLSLKKYEPKLEKPESYDIVIEGKGWTDNTGKYVLETPMTGFAQGDEFEITFEVTLVGKVDFLYFTVLNGKGNPISNSVGVNGQTNGRLPEIKTDGSGTYTYTATMKSETSAGLDISAIELVVYGSGTYALGVNVHIVKK